MPSDETQPPLNLLLYPPGPCTQPDLESNTDVETLPQDGQGRSRPSPLRVRLTAYRLLNMGVVISFGSAKAILSAQGESAAPTTLDWVLGVLFTIVYVYFRLLGLGHVVFTWTHGVGCTMWVSTRRSSLLSFRGSSTGTIHGK